MLCKVNNFILNGAKKGQKNSLQFGGYTLTAGYILFRLLRYYILSMRSWWRPASNGVFRYSSIMAAAS